MKPLALLLLLLLLLYALYRLTNTLPERSPRPYDLSRLLMDAGAVEGWT